MAQHGSVPYDANSDMVWLAVLTIGSVGALAMRRGACAARPARS
jgi:hypothetical protein